MRSHTLLGIIIILLGLSILFHFPIINFLFAFVILWIGVKILTGQNQMFGNLASQTKGTLNEDFVNRVMIFSGIKAKVGSQSFEGAELVTIFGGGEIDASEVKAKGNKVTLDLVAIFGAIKVKVPKGWSVKSEGVGILGGFNNNTVSSPKSTVTVNLKGAAIFGGVEVVN
jgi:hypothetical protein